MPRVELGILEPRMDKGFMFTFEGSTKAICAAYNTAIERVVKEAGLPIFHQVGVKPGEGPHAPGYHAWEIQRLAVVKGQLEELLGAIHKAAEETYPRSKEFYPEDEE